MTKIYSLFSYKSILGCLVSVVCLFYLYQSFDFIMFLKQLQKINFIYLFISILCLIISVLLRSLRWKKIFDSDNVKVMDLYKAEIIGFWGNSIFPLRIGEIIRIHYAKILTLKNYPIILSTIIIERLVDFALLAPFIFIFYLYFPIDIINAKVDFLLLLIPLLIICLLIYLKFSQSIKNKITKNVHGNLLSKFVKNKFFIFYLSILIWLLIFLDVYFVQASMHLDLSLSNCFLIMFIATIVYAIPSSPGTIGTFHVAVQEVMTKILNQSIDESIAFAFVLHAHSYLFFILLGSYYFLKDSKNILSFNRRGSHGLH